MLPNPNVNVALENGELTAHGIATNVFERSLTGAGRVFGIKFRPGGFRPFSDRSVHGLTDRVRPAPDVLPGAATLEAELLGGGDDDEQRDAVERYLRGRQVDPDPRCADVNAMTDALVGNPDTAAWRTCSPSSTSANVPCNDSSASTGSRHGGSCAGATARRRRAGRRSRDGGFDADLGRRRHRPRGGHQAHFIHDFKAATGTPARWAAALTG